MNNSGRVTVFFSLISGVLMILAVTAINATMLYLAKGRVAMGGRTIASSVRAEYNSYIYENYHILLFDKTSGGRGEAYREEQLLALLKENLGEDFSVEDVSISYTLITDNNCEELKNQIHDYIPYALIEYGVSSIAESTGGRDGTLDAYTESNLNDAIDEMTNDEANEAAIDDGLILMSDARVIGTAAMAIPLTSIFSDEYDPRDFTKSKKGSTLLALVLPEGEEPSRSPITTAGLASNYYSSLAGNTTAKINTDFDDISEFASDVHEYASWMNNLTQAGEGVTYARAVFNCLTDKTVNENTVLEYELEYLIEGKPTDKANIVRVVKELIGIRLPVNYAYLIKDVDRMAQVRKISVPLSKLTTVSEKVIRYLIAGCWAYVEAIADVRGLLDGKRLSFFKTSDNWVTDIYNIKSSIMDSSPKEDDNGLCYQDYLMILMSSRMDKAYYRMLDLMELNARQYDDSFRGINAATALSAYLSVIYKNYDCSCEIAVGY